MAVTPDPAAWLVGDDGPIAEDEARARRWRDIADAVARAHGDPEPPTDDMSPADRAYFALQDAADRVLAECAAKRAIIAVHAADPERSGRHECPMVIPAVPELDVEESFQTGYFGDDRGPCPTLLALTQPYAGRPGWRAEWAT